MQVFELPTVLAYPLFYKLVTPESSVVRKDAILHWMSSKQVLTPSSGQMLTSISRDMTQISKEQHVASWLRVHAAVLSTCQEVAELVGCASSAA